MTTPSKIHRQDPSKRAGIAVCGRKAQPDRMTDEAENVTCGVCATWQEAAGPAEPRTTVNAIDRLVQTADLFLAEGHRSDPVETARARGRATGRALRRLATRHVDEFRDLYRDELAAALAEVEELEHLFSVPSFDG